MYSTWTDSKILIITFLRSRRIGRSGAIIPTKSKSYITHEFHLHNFVPDYLDINESAEIRQGKPMSELSTDCS